MFSTDSSGNRAVMLTLANALRQVDGCSLWSGCSMGVTAKGSQGVTGIPYPTKVVCYVETDDYGYNTHIWGSGRPRLARWSGHACPIMNRL